MKMFLSLEQLVQQVDRIMLSQHTHTHTHIYILCIMFASAYCSTAYNVNIRQACFLDVDTEQFGYMSRLGRVFILLLLLGRVFILLI